MFPFDSVSIHTLLNRLQGLSPLGLVRETVTTEVRGELITFSELYIDTPRMKLNNENDRGDMSFFEELNAQLCHRETTLNDYICDYTTVTTLRSTIMNWDLVSPTANSTSLCVGVRRRYQVCTSLVTQNITPFLPSLGIFYCAGIKHRSWGDCGLHLLYNGHFCMTVTHYSLVPCTRASGLPSVSCFKDLMSLMAIRYCLHKKESCT